MNIYILTQEDVLYLPKFVDNFFKHKSSNITIKGVSILKGEVSKKNIFRYFYLMRLRGSIVAGFYFFIYKVLDWLSYIINFEQSFSVLSAFRKKKIPIKRNHSINNVEFIQFLKNNQVDLVVSIACPQIFRDIFINEFDNKIVNIHGSLLPKYRGMLPSFWVLLNQEKYTGVSVHYINNKIDDGDIIAQTVIPIEGINSVHKLLLMSKIKYGPKLLADALLMIQSNNIKPIVNDRNISSYFSFPDTHSISKFYQHGKKII